MAHAIVISAVVPVHNEAGFIDGALPQLVAAMSENEWPFEVIVVENGSTDDTAAIAEAVAEADERVRIIRIPEADYGAAMKRGFTDAVGAWTVNFDIDYFSADFVSSAMALADEADLVLASKRTEGSDDRRSRYRRLGTWGFNLLLRTLFRSRVSDTHGMKMVSRAVVDDLVPATRSTQDLFDTELVLRAERAGYRVLEVPALVEELRSARTRLIGRIPRTVRGLLRIRRQMRRESSSLD